MTDTAKIKAIRIITTCISLVGVVLLGKVVVDALSGSLARGLFPGEPVTWTRTAIALALRVPVPFHVFSVGLILQKRWLPPARARIAWLCTVTSGLWLGAALLVKTFLLH